MLDPDKTSFLWWEPSLRKNLPVSSLAMRAALLPMMDVSQFLSDEKVVPQLQDRLRDYLEV